MGYRKVHFNFDYKVALELDAFLKEVNGMPYSLNFGKLINQQSINIPKGQENKYTTSDRTFFCSELIAKTFKVLGIIENDSISCANYYPVHFSKKADSVLRLTKDTIIDEE